MKLAYIVKKYRKSGLNQKNHPFKEKLKELESTHSTPDDKVKIDYIRYADDFIIGINGSLSLAKDVLRRVTIFLSEELKVELNEEKTQITDIHKNCINFLGFSIQNVSRNKKKFTLKKTVTGRKVRTRARIRLTYYAPFQKILRKLKEQKLIRMKNGVFHGTSRGNLVNLDHADILRYYNTLIRGIYQFYGMANNGRRV